MNQKAGNGGDPTFKDLTPSFEQSDKLSAHPKVTEFLAQEEGLENDFPYRMNIFTDGKITKNDAGVRVSEDGDQIAANNTGQVFYYELLPSAMRVPHWHTNGHEVGTVVTGKMRVEIWDASTKPTIYYVGPGQTWFIPIGKLHSLENVGTDQLKFIVVYDNPETTDRDFVTAWASLPNALLAKSVGLNESDIVHIQKTTVNRLSAFEQTMAQEDTHDPYGYGNDFSKIKPLFSSAHGSVVRLDRDVNAHMGAMALQRTILKPGAMRVPHWYLSGDMLLYVNQGIAYFTMMDDDGSVFHRLIRRGDLISVPVGGFNGFINVGEKDLEIFEAFSHVEEFGEITLMSGAQQFNTDVIQGTTGISKDAAQRIIAHKPLDMIEPFFD